MHIVFFAFAVDYCVFVIFLFLFFDATWWIKVYIKATAVPKKWYSQQSILLRCVEC